VAAEETGMTAIDPPRPDASAPPLWAQELLRSLVPLSSEETIPGDLLEAYRDAVRPSRGRWRANLWYLGQVAGFLFRLAWVFVVLNAAAVILRTILDTFLPPHSYQLRSAWSGNAAIATFLLAGIYGGYRVGRVRAGMLAAVTASAVGHTLALIVGVVLFHTVIRNDPAKLTLFYVTGGWDEAIGMPVIITFIAAVLGSCGGLCGKYLSRLPGRRFAARPSA